MNAPAIKGLVPKTPPTRPEAARPKPPASVPRTRIPTEIHSTLVRARDFKPLLTSTTTEADTRPGKALPEAYWTAA